MTTSSKWRYKADRFGGQRFGAGKYRGLGVAAPAPAPAPPPPKTRRGLSPDPHLDGFIRVLSYLEGECSASNYIDGKIRFDIHPGDMIPMPAPPQLPGLVFGTVNEDAVIAKIAAMPLFEYDPNAKVIVVPPGDWRVTETIFLVAQVLQGAGRDVSRLWVGEEITAVELFADSVGRRNMRAWDDGNSEMGSSVRHLSIMGRKLGVGIKFNGNRVCDNYLIVDVACRTMRLGFYMTSDGVDVGSTREVNFLQCIASNCVIGWMIEDPNVPANPHGTNNVRWSMCDSMYNQDHAVKAVNYSATSTMRILQWYGGIIHGLVPEDPLYAPSLSPKPLFDLDGIFWGLDVRAHFIGPGGDSIVKMRNNTLTHTAIRIAGTWVRHGTTAVLDAVPATTPIIDISEWFVGTITGP